MIFFGTSDFSSDLEQNFAQDHWKITGSSKNHSKSFPAIKKTFKITMHGKSLKTIETFENRLFEKMVFGNI